MESSEFDPNRLIDEIVNNTIQHEAQILGERGGVLVQDNGDLTGDYNGFMVGGHRVTPHPKAKGLKLKPVHKDLLVRGSEYARALNNFDNKVNMLRQGLKAACRGCKTPQDVRDAIPDLLKGAHSDIKKLPRTREEAWTLADKPMQLFQFENLKGLCVYFLSSRMFG